MLILFFCNRANFKNLKLKILREDIICYDCKKIRNLKKVKKLIVDIQEHECKLSNENLELLELSYEGEVANELSFYNLPEGYSYYYETDKNVRKNQTIQLNYKFKNYISNTIITQQVSIAIDDSDLLSYTLNY